MPIYALLGSQLSDNSWQWNDYTYPSGCSNSVASDVPVIPTMGHPVNAPLATIRNDGQSVQYQYVLDPYDADVQGFGPVNSTYCNTFSGISAWISAYDLNTFFVTFRADGSDLVATSKTVLCPWQSADGRFTAQVSLDGGISVTDASPIITSVNPDPNQVSFLPGSMATLTINGRNFGSAPLAASTNSIVFCAHSEASCGQSSNINIASIDNWQEDSIRVTVNVSASATDEYDVQVRKGPSGSGLGFYPQGPSGAYSGRFAALQIVRSTGPSCSGVPPLNAAVTPALGSQYSPGSLVSLNFTAHNVINATSAQLRIFGPGNLSTPKVQLTAQPTGTDYQSSYVGNGLTDLGLYTVNFLLSDSTHQTVCGNAYFSVSAKIYEPPPGQCASAAGVWTSTQSGDSWTLVQAALSGNAAQISGSATNSCIQQNSGKPLTVNGTFTPSTGVLSVTGTPPQDEVEACKSTDARSGTIDRFSSGCLAISGTGTNGNFTWSKTCEVPSGESSNQQATQTQGGGLVTVGNMWDDVEYGPNSLIYNYYQKLTPSTVLFGGRSIQEVDAGGGTDTCTFPDDPVNPTNNKSIPQNSYWIVGPDNSWGPDQLGMSPEGAAFYRAYRPVGSLRANIVETLLVP